MKLSLQSIASWFTAFKKLNAQSTALRIAALGLTALMAVLVLGGIQAFAKVNLADTLKSTHSPAALAQLQQPENSADQLQQNWGGLPTAPNPAPVVPSSTARASAPVPLASPPPPTSSGYTPRQQSAPADPTNYGDRYARDIYGRPVTNAPLIVLHETVGTADSAINTFQTPHLNEDDQTSYHTLIRRDGTLVYIVPPEKRAFGAGNSAFNGSNGLEAVKTHRLFPPSVNNFSYHISLETPLDGENDSASHSGYTDAQYQSLAWLVARTSVPNDRITTHRLVDRSGTRIDPRSFNGEKFAVALQNYPRPYLSSR
jgi:hypothetical protein